MLLGRIDANGTLGRCFGHRGDESVHIGEEDGEARALAKNLMVIAQRNRRLVLLKLLRQFCGVCVSMTLGFPMSWFYSR